jgi:uncharacterized protein (UPF0262 family)
MADSPPPRDIVSLSLDSARANYRDPTIQHEKDIITRDLLDANQFRLKAGESPPYHLQFTLKQDQLYLGIFDAPQKQNFLTIQVNMRPYKRLIKDYFIIWESYHEALKTGAPEKLQAVDMGRRAIHDEAARLLEKRLQPEVSSDFNTIRRMFSLICVLHIK